MPALVANSIQDHGWEAPCFGPLSRSDYSTFVSNMVPIWKKLRPNKQSRGLGFLIMLIHGVGDRNIPSFHSDEIRSHNLSNVVIWKVPGALHTGAYKIAPEEFQRKILDWFGSHKDNNAGCPTFRGFSKRGISPMVAP